MNTKNVLIAAALLGTVSTAQAGHASPSAGHHGRSAHFRDTARVIDVEPVVSWRKVEVQRRVCEPRHDYDDDYSDNRRGGGNDDYLLPTVLGGVAGSVIGSQVHDRGARAVTTAAGSVVGAVVGYSLSQAGFEQVGNRHHHHHGRQCRTVTEYQRERHVEAYRVTYRYHGHQFVTRTHEYPGHRIPVRVKLHPDY